MAGLTVAIQDLDSKPVIQAKRVKITFDSSYATGGETLDASDCGFTVVLGVVPLSGASGYTFQYESGKIKVYWVDTTTDGAAQAEVASTTDLSAVAVTFLVFGLVV